MISVGIGGMALITDKCNDQGFRELKFFTIHKNTALRLGEEEE